MRKEFLVIKEEVKKLVVGQDEVVDSLLRGLISDGHVLIEGVPGVAKTLLIRSMANASGCDFARVQFTVDLLPTDITGITTYTPGKGFSTLKGPVFTNFLIADEINRAPPKTQSALLEAMQEKQVTIAKRTFTLPSPFFVMANNNPLESSGTYPLPEAQVDRFLFKLNMGYITTAEEKEVLDRNISIHKFEDFKLKKIISPGIIKRMQKEAKELKATDKLREYIIKIVDATRHPKKYGIRLGRYIEWGGSPRAGIALYIGAKADAYLKGDKFVSPKHVKAVAKDALRHRLILNYLGQAEKIKTDDIISEILDKINPN